VNFIIKNKSIKTIILLLFGLFGFLLILSFIVQLLYIDDKTAKNTIHIELANLIGDINSLIKNEEQLNFSTIQMLSLMNKKNKDENFKIYIDVLKIYKKYSAIYTGYSNGSVYGVINLDINKKLRDTYNVKDTDKWMLRKTNANNLKVIKNYFYDENLNKTSEKVEFIQYDVRTRPWYKLALEKDGKIGKTTPYKFKYVDAFGFVYTKQLNNTKNVIAIDILLEDFKDFLKDNIDTNIMDLFLFRNNTKQVTASITKNENLFKEFFESYEDISYFKDLQVAKINDKKYYIQIVPIQSNIKDQYLILFADYKKTIQPYHIQTLKQVSILVLICLFMIPIILYFAKIIVKPIFALLNESNKIKNRDYDKVVKIDSSSLEVSLLSNSFFNMAKSIHEHQHLLEQKINERTKELHLKNKELLKLSITDKLTGLYNRLKLDNVLQENMDRAFRYNTIFSVIIIDIDFFKNINDTFGHQVGDDVLKESAKLLKNNIRKVDLIGRWGGEEFLIVCPQTPLSGAKVLALELNKIIKNYKFTTYAKNVTISIGCACYKPKVTSTYDEIVSNADKALYVAKENGRDRVEVFE